MYLFVFVIWKVFSLLKEPVSMCILIPKQVKAVQRGGGEFFFVISPFHPNLVYRHYHETHH